MRERLHRREKEAEVAAKRDDSQPAHLDDAAAPHEPAPAHVTDHHVDPKIERANYESTHSRSHGTGSLTKEARIEPVETASAPVSTNGNASSGDKAHKSGELHPQDESEADAHSPDRPKSDS